jgi:hypothetical protein
MIRELLVRWRLWQARRIQARWERHLIEHPGESYPPVARPIPPPPPAPPPPIPDPRDDPGARAPSYATARQAGWLASDRLARFEERLIALELVADRQAQLEHRVLILEGRVRPMDFPL